MTEPERPRKLLAPQTYVKLAHDTAPDGTVSTYILNKMTMERTRRILSSSYFPLMHFFAAAAPQEWQLGISEDPGEFQGLAYVSDGAQTSWTSDLFRFNVWEEFHAVGTTSTELYELGEKKCNFDELRAHCDFVDLRLAPQTWDQTGKSVRSAAFRYPSPVGRVWIDTEHLFKTFKFNILHGNGSDFFHNRKGRMMTLCNLFMIDIEAYRPSLSYSSADATNDRERTVPFPSLHISLVYLYSFFAAFNNCKSRGGVSDPTDKAKFRAIVEGITAWIRPKSKLEVKLDADAERLTGGRFAGRNPCTLLITETGLVDLSEFAEVLRRMQPALHAKTFAALAGHYRYNGKPFIDYITAIVIGISQSSPKLVRVVAAQVVAAAVDEIEAFSTRKLKQYCVGGGATRVLSQADSETPMERVAQSTIMDGNWRHVERELERYRLASKVAFNDTQCISLSGPDATKIGADLSVMVAFAMDPVAKIVACMPPQDP
ncbi:unnamed protein product, partial [Prorocentrum cordatum]